MTIYYNPTYSAAPYRNGVNDTEFGNIYCGDIQLLQRLLFYAGVPFVPANNEERVACYHAHMQKCIESGSPFYKSFKTDSAGMSRAILAWRDALVEVGWDMGTYAGNSLKLSFIRDVEPKAMPKGEADYWCQLIQLAAERKILGEGADIVVTCRENEIKPHIAHILAKQQALGVRVEYRPIDKPCAEGNMGRIQSAVLGGSKEEIVLDKNDDSFNYIKFATDDEALRYVATEPVDRSALYYCSKPKRFDNTLKLLGKPTIGSSLDASLPQVVQLFVLGNGLFEYPLNIQRIIEWLNMPVSPIRGGLRRVLSKALIDSGGINNKDWNAAKDDYLKSQTDENERKKIVAQYEKFLPLPQDDVIDVESVIEFNKNLYNWAATQLSMEDTNHAEIVREQIAAVKNYCSSLVSMLENAPEEFKFLDLQLWCKNIAQPSVYGQYEAELASHTTIATMGDIHDPAEKIVWFPAEDSGAVAYPFEMLNETEYAEVESCGAMPYKREQHSLINQTMMLRLLLNAKSLTIIEAEKCKGEKVARHPLVLQLDERIKGKLKGVAQSLSIAEEHMTKDRQVVNQSENPLVVQLDEQAKLRERHERYTDEAKQAESYSSLSQLIQHPFSYVCEKCARLSDHVMPSAQDIDKILGNVAHLIIENVFDGRSLNEARQYCYSKSDYEAIFEKAVNETGLVLRLPENAIDLLRLKDKMFGALRALYDVIADNDLIVDACEYEFKQTKWTKAGEGVMLGSRADMLLSDNRGGKVIFDFKYSRSKSRKTEVEENRALQLEVYKYMAKQEFGQNTPVRVAYVHLPDVALFTADDLVLPEGQRILAKTDERKDVDVMLEAANSYRFRWEQLKAGKIERVEGCGIGTGEYGKQETEKGLFPLSAYDKERYDTDKFDKGYKNLK